MNKIFYNANTQYANTGDLLIHRSLLQSLAQFGEIIIENKTLPKWYLDRLKVENCSVLSDYTRAPLSSYILKCCLRRRKKDVIYYVDGLGHKMSTGKKRAFQTLFLSTKLMVLKLFGCRILRFGVTLGPYDNWNAIAEAINSRSFYYYSVRDEASLLLARKMNFTTTRYFPDLGWSYQLNDPVIPPVVNSGQKKSIVLSFRSNSLGATSEKKYLDYILSRLEVLLAKFDASLINIVVVYQVEYDKEASEAIARKFSKTYSVELINERLFIEEAAAKYATAELVISNRLHVLLLAAIAGSVPIAFMNIAKHTKVYNIFSLNKLLDLVIDTEYEDSKIQEQIIRIRSSRSHYRNLIDETIKKNTSEKNLILNQIFNSANSGR